MKNVCCSVLHVVDSRGLVSLAVPCLSSCEGIGWRCGIVATIPLLRWVGLHCIIIAGSLALMMMMMPVVACTSHLHQPLPRMARTRVHY